MNLFGVVNIVAEFVGSGIQPYVRIDILTLTRLTDFTGTVTTIAEVDQHIITVYATLLDCGSLFYIFPLHPLHPPPLGGRREYGKWTWRDSVTRFFKSLFFAKNTLPRPHMNRLKLFREHFPFREDMRLQSS